jgi:crotonobetainyl-CoA:carnitine CoA-transferase CaiB-like acyl-CoA transferase
MTAPLSVSPPSQPRPGPLSGLRVIEMGQLLAGPFSGQLLGDLGADVIKLEDPAKGDPMRQWGRELPAGHSLWWAVVGRNKRSVTVNLRAPEGQDIARQLIAEADVMIENFKPGTLEKWGLSYEVLSKDNPGLVQLRVSGFGQDGPYAQRPGYGSIGEAMGGLRYVAGDPSAPPSRAGVSLGDGLAAVFGTIGVLSALFERARTGLGQVIDASIYEAVLAMTESMVPEYALTGYIRERSGAVLPNVAPSNVYPTKDGLWLLLAANQDTVFRRLAQAMGQPELGDDPRFSTHGARGEHMAEIDDLISRWTATWDSGPLEEHLIASGVPVGRIFRAPEMLADPQFIARESITRVPHPDLGEVPMQNVFPRLSRTPGAVSWPGPSLGEHTAEVLGLDEDTLARLRAAGVL